MKSKISSLKKKMFYSKLLFGDYFDGMIIVRLQYE